MALAYLYMPDVGVPVREVATDNFQRLVSGLKQKPANCLDVGGTNDVYLESRTLRLGRRRKLLQYLANALGEEIGPGKREIITARNPLLGMFDKVTFLDMGFNNEEIGTETDIKANFLDAQSIQPLLGKYDIVTCFDTLEHVSEPQTFCKNLLLATRNGGYVFLSTVFSYPYHPSPMDYFRFTPEGLSACFQDAAATVIETGWESDNAGVYLLARKH